MLAVTLTSIMLFCFHATESVGQLQKRSVSMSYSFNYKPKMTDRPQLVLISGCTGSGKSTFGMTIALNQGVLRCISTDSVRQVMRSFISPSISPALHRSSYSGTGDPIQSWRECCQVMEDSIDGLVNDAINRGVSLVLEGVHIVPSNTLIDKWKSVGGDALGCLLVITDEESHRDLIFKRGEITKKGSEKQESSFHRIRAIQQEMINLATAHEWLQIEQELGPNPMDIVSDALISSNVKKPTIS